MGRFFNKYELINIMLVILLLGMNSFTEISTSYITYENKRNHIGLILAMSFILLDIYIYSTLVSSRPLPDVIYQTAEKIALDCEHENEKQIQDAFEKIRAIKNLCKKPTYDPDIILSKKIVVGFIVTVIIVIITTSITLGGSDPNSNSLKMRILLSLPLVALAGGVVGISSAV